MLETGAETWPGSQSNLDALGHLPCSGSQAAGNFAKYKNERITPEIGENKGPATKFRWREVSGWAPGFGVEGLRPGRLMGPTFWNLSLWSVIPRNPKIEG
jgi:hypothetical protein